MEEQAAGGRKQRRHGLLMRWLLRAPVLVYRLGLGGLMPGRPMLGGLMPGHLMLTTVGRRSGRLKVRCHEEAVRLYEVRWREEGS